MRGLLEKELEYREKKKFSASILRSKTRRFRSKTVVLNFTKKKKQDDQKLKGVAGNG